MQLYLFVSMPGQFRIDVVDTNDLFPDGIFQQTYRRSGADLLFDVLPDLLDGPDAQEELIGDLLITFLFPYQAQDLSFPLVKDYIRICRKRAYNVLPVPIQRFRKQPVAIYTAFRNRLDRLQ